MNHDLLKRQMIFRLVVVFLITVVIGFIHNHPDENDEPSDAYPSTGMEINGQVTGDWAYVDWLQGGKLWDSYPEGQGYAGDAILPAPMVYQTKQRDCLNGRLCLVVPLASCTNDKKPRQHFCQQGVTQGLPANLKR